MIVCNKVFRRANEAISAPAHFYGRITSSVVGKSDAKISRPFAYRLRDGPPWCRTVDRKKSWFILSPVGNLDVRFLWLKSLL